MRPFAAALDLMAWCRHDPTATIRVL